MSAANGQAGGSLTNTLVLALSQCQEQVHRIAEQGRTIDILGLENERLKQELDQIRSVSSDDTEARYRAQFQNAFRQVAEKQVQIDLLKEKLRSVKIKAQRRGILEPISSSPAVPLSEDERTSLIGASPSVSNAASDHEGGERSPRVRFDDLVSRDPVTNKKRLRSPITSKEPLQEVSVNVEPIAATLSKSERPKAKAQSRMEQSIAAIPELAEDGDDHALKKRRTESDNKSTSVPQAVYHRLGDLLDARMPTSPVLYKARSTTPPSDATVTITPARPTAQALGLPTPNSSARPKRPRSALIVSKRFAPPDPEDEEPYRSRPLNRLGLIHFKLNPALNSGLDFAFNQVVRGQERRCLPGCTRGCCIGAFRALADTLPNLTDEKGQIMSDDAILEQFLGAGSEERIRNLTPMARENLVHDARVKFAADAYGKMHRDPHERGKSPPGFWRTDMPGSQEAQQDQMEARVFERDEVFKRHNEAMKEGGRWIFADE